MRPRTAVIESRQLGEVAFADVMMDAVDHRGHSRALYIDVMALSGWESRVAM